MSQAVNADMFNSGSDSPRPMIDLFENLPNIVDKKEEQQQTEVNQEQSDQVNLAFSDNALEVLKRRYLKRDVKGNPVETVQDLFNRVANAVAYADVLYNPDADLEAVASKFYRLMITRDFMPNSPTLMNAGRSLGQLSACFVLPVEDSMESIFQSIKDTALIHKSGGGTGFSFSRLRPRNSIVKSTNGVASGPVSFMKVFNSATEAVKQGGTRRGANMGILRVDHPDILEFINCKIDQTELTNFNISVAVTDEFMEKVRSRENYDLIDPHTNEKAGTLNAFEVFKLMAKNAWLNGDPGVVFIDKINKRNPTPSLGMIEATNPCGEQPLLPNEACNLGSINLVNFLKDGEIDYDRLGEVVEDSVHFLDNVIDVNKYPLKKIDTMVKKTRKIGLGVMGFADLLYCLNIPYNSEAALALADKIMEFIYMKAKDASCRLAEERGTFPIWDKSIYAPYGPKLRNATLITIAPTGTISMIADTSSGIEPNFSLVYTKRVLDGTNLLYVNPHFERTAREKGFYSEDLMLEIAKKGSIQGFEQIPAEVKEVFVTAHDITPEWHVRMQAAFQKWVDDAVSKTCNFPHDATVQDVIDAYWLAYEAGCKGITIYRDGSRDEQVLYVGDKTGETPSKKQNSEGISSKPVEQTAVPDKTRQKTISPAEKEFVLKPRKRPQQTRGVTKRVKTSEGTLYVTINEDDYGICEVFMNVGKAGGLAQSYAEAIARLISLALRSGIDPHAIVKHLKGIGGPNLTWENGRQFLSTPDAIGKVLEDYLKERVPGGKEEKPEPSFVILDSQPDEEIKNVKREALQLGTTKKTIIICPDCGATVFHESGCVTCPSCGWSKC